ncbi:unnamed protein product [Pseudo-nitzschia multistriata]|uniref:VTT domain-containing protein n=1 Tax=Pseudo-nitzschia multistriata TaxID=183589 RepID=A0A448Z5W2_9STRA|nr:unnamed protein product [Pseudo-nitzschia multistriata]
MPSKKQSLTAPSESEKATGGTEGEAQEEPPPPPELLVRRNDIGGTTRSRSFVELTIRGETVGALETTPPPEPPARRSLLWQAFSCNLFEANRKSSSQELTEKLQQQEVDSLASSNSSWDRNPSGVPYAKIGGPQSSSLPPPQFLHQQEEMPPPSFLHQQEQNPNPRQPQNHPRAFGSEIRMNSFSRNEATSPLQSDYPLHSRENSFNHRGVDYRGASAGAGDRNDPSNASKHKPPDTESPPTEPTRWQEFTTELKSLLVDLIKYGKAKTWKKKILTAVLFVVSVLVFYDLFFGKQDFIVTWLHAFVLWMTTHQASAVFAFVGIFVLSTLAFVPPTLLVFGAGYAFTVAMDSALAGVTAAVLSSFLGSCIGAVLAFIRSRYMMRDLVKLFANRYPLVRAIDQALKVRHGFRLMLLLRFCPVIPYNALNYCCGITGVTLYDFTLSLVGILPFQIFTIVLGATAGTVELKNLKNEYTRGEMGAFVGFLVIGIAFGLVAVVYAWRLVKWEIKRELGLSTEEFEYMIQPPPAEGHDRGLGTGSSERSGSSSPGSYHLQDDGEGSFRDPSAGRSTGNANASASAIATSGTPPARGVTPPARGTPFQEEGEEWFWMWA